MSETDLQGQLAELKRQVVALSEAREASVEAVGSPAAPEDEETTLIGSEALQHAEELVQLLEKELRENPVLSGLAIFVAGLLVGRLMR